MIAYKHLLTTKQKQDILNTLQTGSGVKIKPTKAQSGGFFSAYIGVPLAIEAIKKMTGKGAPRMRRSTRSLPRRLSRSTTQQTTSQGGPGAPRISIYQPPPFIGIWEQAQGNTIGMGTKQNPRKSKKAQGILLGANSLFKNVPPLNILLQNQNSTKHINEQPCFNTMV